MPGTEFDGFPRSIVPGQGVPAWTTAFFVDSGYAGRCAQTVSQCHDIQVQVVRHPANRKVGRWTSDARPDLFTVQADAKSFVVLAKRWVVERTRRLVMHHDRLAGVSETWVWLSEARRLIQRLTA
jgi:transposase